MLTWWSGMMIPEQGTRPEAGYEADWLLRR